MNRPRASVTAVADVPSPVTETLTPARAVPFTVSCAVRVIVIDALVARRPWPLSAKTLNFTLPFKTPLKAKELKVEIYDPTIFVDFSFAKEKPAQLVGAPKCKLDVVLPREMTFAEGKKLSEIPVDQPNTTMAWGAQFATKLLVHCP